MEKIYLGDYVEAIVPHLNLKESMKVVATKYDVLAQKYVEFELSNSNKKEKNFINLVLHKKRKRYCKLSNISS